MSRRCGTRSRGYDPGSSDPGRRALAHTASNKLLALHCDVAVVPCGIAHVFGECACTFRKIAPQPLSQRGGESGMHYRQRESAHLEDCVVS